MMASTLVSPFRIVFPLVCGLGLLVFTGCDSESDSSTPVAVQEVSPQEKFDRVLDKLREQLQGTGPRHHTIHDSAGSGMATISYEIEVTETVDSVIEPGKPLKATIEVTQNTSYSSLRTESSDDEAETEEPDQSPVDPLESLGKEEKDLLGDDSIGEEFLKPTSPKLDLPRAITKPIERSKTVTYQLIFENNRWRMAVPPSKDSLDSTNLAMQMALDRQG
ncbi:hypothetical protein [Aeoliella mucimassa]|nr:hypothetical protein [Aeoliella mucimassa]